MRIHSWRRSAAPARDRSRFSVRLSVETLEERTVLSTAQPGYQLVNPLNSVLPLATSSPNGYTPAQVRHAYGFDQIQFPGGIAGDGSGQTIAIVDAYDAPTIQADLDAFSTRFGLPTTSGGQFTFSKVSQTGSATALPAPDSGWAVEISLDVEWVHAIAPKANILLVESTTNDFNDIFTAIGYAANQPGVSVVSMSFGGDEFSGEASLDDMYFVTPAGHNGVAYVASAGDSGAPPEYPSASPNVLAVGGTSLQIDSTGNYISESSWGGGGGGISAYESQPAYQNGVVTQSSTQRTAPDVAYDASPGTGFPVYDSYTYGAATPWQQVGGTSAGAPQWAALVAIANQGRVRAGLGTLDGASQLLPTIYSLPSSHFHDVTTGNSTGTPNYSAGPGYDLVTGRGTPIANLVVADLVGASSTTASTSTSLTSSANPSVFGQSVTFTATVTSPGGTPTGSVTFLNGTSTLGTGALNNGTASFTTSSLPVGGYSITAVYGGVTGFSGSQSTALTQNVSKDGTSVFLTSSANPATFGSSVTFTATVAALAPGSGTPTGTVTFLDGSTTIGSGTLNNGKATFSTNSLSIGGHTITASYGGNGNFTGQTSSPLTETVSRGTTTTQLTSSVNPSLYGQSVTFTATVTGSSGTPTGTVTFLNGTKVLATKTLSGGLASFAISTLAAGSNAVTASYSGDTANAGGTSAAVSQVVNKGTTTATLTASPSPATAGQVVTLTATFAAVAPSTGAINGTVTFKDGTTTLGLVRLSNNVATLQVSGLGAGSHSLTATWYGDSNYKGSTSNVFTLTVGASGSVVVAGTASPDASMLVRQSPILDTVTANTVAATVDSATLVNQADAGANGLRTQPGALASGRPVDALWTALQQVTRSASANAVQGDWILDLLLGR